MHRWFSWSGWLGAFWCLAGLGAAPLSTNLVVHSGMCDASAALPLDAEHFVVANDEDNSLRVYHNRRSGPPVMEVDLSSFLAVEKKSPESDLEGAARIKEHVFWITSHARNSEGKLRPSRYRLFATTVGKLDGRFVIQPVGQPYKGLLDDLLNHPPLRPFGLARGSQLAPKSEGGLNIEGLCSTPDHQLLIGFRNPIPGGRALLVPLLNPEETLAGKGARLGEPILIDLGGMGIRDILRLESRYVVVAGPYDTGKGIRLFSWAGGNAVPQPVSETFASGISPEAVMFYPEHPGFLQITSDDGTRSMGGEPCKDLKDPMRRQFRSLWVPWR